MSARYLVNLEPKRARSIARLLRRLARECYRACPPMHRVYPALPRAYRESRNLMACANAAEKLLKVDLAEKKGKKR